MKRIGLLGLVAILLSWASPSLAGDFKVYPGAQRHPPVVIFEP